LNKKRNLIACHEKQYQKKKYEEQSNKKKRDQKSKQQTVYCIFKSIKQVWKTPAPHIARDRSERELSAECPGGVPESCDTPVNRLSSAQQKKEKTTRNYKKPPKSTTNAHAESEYRKKQFRMAQQYIGSRISLISKSDVRESALLLSGPLTDSGIAHCSRSGIEASCTPSIRPHRPSAWNKVHRYQERKEKKKIGRFFPLTTWFACLSSQVDGHRGPQIERIRGDRSDRPAVRIQSVIFSSPSHLDHSILFFF
jgi:hypothetical protein